MPRIDEKTKTRELCPNCGTDNVATIGETKSCNICFQKWKENIVIKDVIKYVVSECNCGSLNTSTYIVYECCCGKTVKSQLLRRVRSDNGDTLCPNCGRWWKGIC